MPLNFSRPELSECLRRVKKDNSKYTQALEIIHAGKAQLEKQPRADMLGADAGPIARADVERHEQWVRQVKMEAASRKAILDGENAGHYREESDGDADGK